MVVGLRLSSVFFRIFGWRCHDIVSVESQSRLPTGEEQADAPSVSLFFFLRPACQEIEVLCVGRCGGGSRALHLGRFSHSSSHSRATTFELQHQWANPVQDEVLGWREVRVISVSSTPRCCSVVRGLSRWILDDRIAGVGCCARSCSLFLLASR